LNFNVRRYNAADAFDAVLLRPNDPNAKSFCKRHVAGA